MECRIGCGACCIAPSISSAIPGMPNGKRAGERCIQLNDHNMCAIFNHANRPNVCDAFQADREVCGNDYQQAFDNLIELENLT